MSETSPVISRKHVVAANNSMVSLTKTLSNCQEQLRLAERQLDERCELLKEVSSEALSLSHDDPWCWTNQFTSVMCCSPPPSEILEVGTRSLPSNAVALLMKSIFMCCVVSDINWCVQWCSCQFCFCWSSLEHYNNAASPVLFSRGRFGALKVLFSGVQES